MTVTALFFLPLAPNAPSPTPALTFYISRKFLTSSAPLPPYHLDHRLLVDTSSLLPNHPFSIHPRRYTQFLTLSHLPGRTYVGTSSTATAPTPAGGAAASTTTAATTDSVPPPASAPMTIISVPSGPPAEELFWTTTRKMEPLWAFRSSLRVENGAAFSLRGGDLRVRLGDARIVLGQGQGRVRGMVAEVAFSDVDEDDISNGAHGEAENVEHAVDWEGREKLLQSFWDGLVGGSEVGMDRLQVVVKVPGVAKGENYSLTLVRQYMELLRFPRP